MKIKKILIAGFLLTSCVQQMGRKNHIDVYEKDSSTAPPGAVPQKPEQDVEKLRPKISKNFVLRGQEVYKINCTPCHGPAGDGDGSVVQRGFPAPESFHSNRLHLLKDADIFLAVSQGKGKMYGFAERVSIEDRWAVTEYIRALQLSQSFSWQDLSEKEKKMGELRE
jgi:mono/diheme cytochrome c family protein